MKANTFLIFLCTALSSTGCGAKHGGSVSQPDATVTPPTSQGDFRADGLGLDLTGPSQVDPAVPGGDPFQGGVTALDPAYFGQELILNNVLTLPASGGTQAFFVWPEGAGKNRIVQASFAVRNQSIDNRLGGEPTYELASHDQDGKRYFVRLDRALSAQVQDLGPADEQILLLRLTLDGGTNIDLTVRYRVAGPLEKLEVLNDQIVLPGLTGPLFAGRSLPFPLRRVTLRNPLARPVTLWLKAGPSAAGLWFSAQMGMGAVQLNSPLHLSRIVDLRSGTSVAWGDWAPIRFASHEPVTLEWDAITAGCPGREELGVLRAHGDWSTDTWLTDGSIRGLPSDFASLPVSLSLNAGRISGAVDSGTHPSVWGSGASQVNCP